MKKSNMKKTVVMVLVVLMTGFAGIVYANQGMGMGYGKAGYGPHHGQGRMAAALSEEDQQKLNVERKAFFEATRDLRQEIYSKGLELRSELAKKDVDMNRAKAIQKDLSSLEASFDLKQLEHRVAMQKLFPELGMGMGKGMGGHGRGMMRGQGNCPRFAQ